MRIANVRWRISKESNEESDDFTEEVLFFGWDEGVTKALGLKLDEVWSSFSNEVIYFSIEDVSFSNEGLSFLNEQSSLKVSE